MRCEFTFTSTFKYTFKFTLTYTFKLYDFFQKIFARGVLNKNVLKHFPGSNYEYLRHIYFDTVGAYFANFS